METKDFTEYSDFRVAVNSHYGVDSLYSDYVVTYQNGHWSYYNKLGVSVMTLALNTLIRNGLGLTNREIHLR